MMTVAGGERVSGLTLPRNPLGKWRAIFLPIMFS